MNKVTDMELFLMQWINMRNSLRKNSSGDEDDWIWIQRLNNASHLRENDALFILQEKESTCEKDYDDFSCPILGVLLYTLH